MLIIGLTGSIAMGKSTVSRFMRRDGLPVYDADAAVHRLYAAGGAAVAPIEAAFPGTTGVDGVDRARLWTILQDAPDAVRQLEHIVHPLVRQKQQQFLRAMARRRAPMVVLDIPLLFETGGDRRCDVILVVSAPAMVQRQRVLRRPDMTPAKLAQILSRQMPDREKRRRATLVIPTHMGFAATAARVRSAVDGLRDCRGRVWPAFYRRQSGLWRYK